MTSILRGLAAEITPEWMTPKAVEPDAREEPADKPMPTPTWKPKVEKTPLDPKENEGEFDEDRETGESDARHGLTPYTDMTACSRAPSRHVPAS